jgi:cyclic beta-1,2-glucan synthetase
LSAGFFPRLRNNIQTLRAAHRYIGVQASTGYDISPAAEWLLDNFHLIEAQLEEIHEGLPRRYFRALPVLIDEPLAGLPRVYGVAWAFVAHTDGDFDEELLIQFLSAYQETRELNLGEMWALPTTLRVVLIENLRRLAERIATNKAAREVANLCCDRIDSMTAGTLDQLLAMLNSRGVGRVFLGQMAQRMQDGRGQADMTGDGAEPLVHKRASDRADDRAEQHEWLRRALPDPALMQAQKRAEQTADNLSVSNAVTSLRAIGDALRHPLEPLPQRVALFAREDTGFAERERPGLRQPHVMRPEAEVGTDAAIDGVEERRRPAGEAAAPQLVCAGF